VWDWLYDVDLYLDAGLWQRIPELINWAKLGILIGSLLAAVIGYTLLREIVRTGRPA
jgi:Na+/H+ antiporter NhaA